MTRRRDESQALNLSDRGRLRLFLEQLAELRATRLFRERKVGFSFTATGDAAGTSVSVDLPDKDDLRSYLVSLRPFVLSNDAVHLTSVYNLCRQNVRTPELRERLDEWRAQWKQVSKRAGLRVIIDDHELISAEVFDLWVNAIFHTDPDKRQRLAALDGIDAVLFHQVFGDFIIAATEQTIELSWIVEDVLRSDLAEENAST